MTIGRPALVAVDVLAWGVVHAGTGYLVHRIPQARLDSDGWLWRPRTVEREGRLYTGRLGIRRWKDHLPEAGAMFAGGFSKRSLLSSAPPDLRRFVVETRRAELGHWLALLSTPLFALWNPAWVMPLMALYGAAANAPCIAVQRFNRLRLQRILARQGGPT